MSSLVLPATFELRLRAIRNRRRSSRLTGLVKFGVWLTGLAAAVTIAGGVLVGTN